MSTTALSPSDMLVEAPGRTRAGAARFVLIPLSPWFASLKRRRRDWWLGYL